MDFEEYLDEIPHFSHVDSITRMYMVRIMTAAYNQALEDVESGRISIDMEYSTLSVVKTEFINSLKKQ